MDSTLNRGTAVALVLSASAFVAALLFYGNQINYVLLGLSLTLAVAGIFVSGFRVELSGWMTFWLWMSALGIWAAFAVSPSPDSSFAVACVIALVPLAAALGMALGSARTLLWSIIGAIVIALAIVSAARLGLEGTRPQAPLTDANSYGALLYVILLILTGRILDQQWRGERSWSWYPGLLVTVVLTFVIAGTESRACIFIVLAAAMFWLLYALRHRLDLRPLAAVLGAGALGVFAYGILTNQSQLEGSAETIAGGVSVRLTLVESALTMYREHGVAGIGLYIFPLLYRQVRTPADDDTAGLFVHNDYVQLLVEGGPLLVAPVIAVAIWVLAVLLRSLSGGARGDSGEPLAAALALGALLAHAMVNFVFYTPVLGFLFGLLVASVLKLPAPATHGALRALPGVTLIPVVLLAVSGCGYLWLDIVTSVKLQGQPGFPFVLQPAVEQRQQLAYARLAQKLNSDRGLPFLAEAFILDKDRTLLGADAEQTVLQAYRRAIEVDPWNTFAWWQFRDFIFRTESVRDQLHASEQPESITREVLRLDPLFVPAIEGRLAELVTADASETRQHRLEFLRSHVGPRLTWLARQDPRAALHYADVLLQYSTSVDDRAHWNEIREQVLAVQPLVPERWLVKASG